MAKEYSVRTFKSGNSVAIRLPKALGFEEGVDVAIVPHRDGSLTFWRLDDAAAVLDRLYGAFSPGFMADGRGGTEQPERDWSDRSHDQAV